MHVWRIAVLVVGALWFTAVGAQAQTQSGSASTAPAPTASAPTAAAPAADGGQRVLTPEQIEELQAMVGRMQSAMKDMVASARSTAGRLADGGQTVVVSTTEIAAIALGAAGGAIVIDLLGGGGLATIAGAVVGGVAAHWIITYPPVAKSVGES